MWQKAMLKKKQTTEGVKKKEGPHYKDSIQEQRLWGWGLRGKKIGDWIGGCAGSGLSREKKNLRKLLVREKKNVAPRDRPVARGVPLQKKEGGGQWIEVKKIKSKSKGGRWQRSRGRKRSWGPRQVEERPNFEQGESWKTHYRERAPKARTRKEHTSKKTGFKNLKKKKKKKKQRKKKKKKKKKKPVTRKRDAENNI